jgi:hypothetical protein
MKSSLFITLLLIFQNCFSDTGNDEIKNATCITIGPSASILARLGKLNNSTNIYRAQNSPPINLMCDWRSSTNFTIGIALHYENFKYYRQLNTNNGINLSNTNNLYTFGKFSEYAYGTTHVNAGVRLLYHKIKDDNDFYGGIRLGYDYFSKVVFSRAANRSPFGVQLIAGYRKFVGRIGFNIEAGIGNPYWCMTGINIKLEE